MSLILDALNRADRERGNPQLTAGLSGGAQSNTSGSLPLLRWALELLVLVAVAGFFYQQSRPAGEAATDVNSGTTAPVLAAPSKTTATKTAMTKSSTTKTAVTGITELANTGTGATTTATAAIDALYRQQSAQAIRQPTISAQVPSKTVAKPSTAIDSSLAILNSIPLLAQMPQRLQRRVPTIDYTVHIYAEAGGMVVLNGKQLKTGAQLSPQLRITAILKDSLVLEFDGSQFRLAALNSWMNFN